MQHLDKCVMGSTQVKENIFEIEFKINYITELNLNSQTCFVNVVKLEILNLTFSQGVLYIVSLLVCK